MSNRRVRNKARVAVVDDDADMRMVLKDILESSREFSCEGCFADATEALAGLPGLHPDLVLMDIRMPGLGGIECTARLKRLLPHVITIMVSGAHDADSIEKSSQAGAAGYLTKPVTPDQCVAALRFALKTRRRDNVRLSQRDNEVMQCLADGLLYKEIADKLGISYSTVHKHQHRIFRKLGVSNRTEAIRQWRDDDDD